MLVSCEALEGILIVSCEALEGILIVSCEAEHLGAVVLVGWEARARKLGWGQEGIHNDLHITLGH